MTPNETEREEFMQAWIDSNYRKPARARLDGMIQAAILAERERAAKVAEAISIPFEKDLAERTSREKFYQRHIKAAWSQCAQKCAQAIRAGEEGG